MTALTGEDLEQFHNCERTQDAIKILGEGSTGESIISNGKAEQFEQAIQHPSTGDYIVIVDEQKTHRHCGPAETSMSERMYSYIKISNDHIQRLV